MSQSYIPAAKEYLPGIDIVFDRFHVMALMNRALDEVRRVQCRKAQDSVTKHVIKGQRFLLLRNYATLSTEQSEQVNALFKVNIPLFQAHAFKEQLRLFWALEGPAEATLFLLHWIDGVRQTKLPPLIKVANTLENYLTELINYFKHNKISNGKAEGINNKIKTLKRQSYGFRDMEYFKLRLYHLHAQKDRLCG